MSRLSLSRAALASLPASVARPAYDPARLATGILHIGPGAFFRAHIASYIDELLARDPRWGIAGVALRHGAQADALAAQDRLYTLAELESDARYRILGALTEYRAAPRAPSATRALFAAPAIRLITITVTEKGYCLAPDGTLDTAHPAIAHDLATPDAPTSLIGWLAAGLAARRAEGCAPPTVMSCDNLASNGGKLRAAVIAFAQAAGRRDLAEWIAGEVRFPATMVDSIVPATDDALIARVAAATGLNDYAPVQRERFRQWVIANDLGPNGPDLAGVGATLTNDVHLYETAKLRLLNGVHSALAYLGLLRGHATVAEAMRDVPLAAFAERLMRDDSAATLAPGLDVPSYIDTLLARLRNPAIAHRLIQIAADGSQKLPYRWLAPIAELLKAGRPVARAAVPVAAWMRFVFAETRRGNALIDPLASEITAAASACTGDAVTDVPRFLALTQIFPRDLAHEPLFISALTAAYASLDRALQL